MNASEILAKEEEILKSRKMTREDFEYLKMALKHTLESVEEHGITILPHLTDTDENSGEQLRYFMWKCGLGDMKGIRRSSYKDY